METMSITFLFFNFLGSPAKVPLESHPLLESITLGEDSSVHLILCTPVVRSWVNFPQAYELLVGGTDLNKLRTPLERKKERGNPRQSCSQHIMVAMFKFRLYHDYP